MMRTNHMEFQSGHRLAEQTENRSPLPLPVVYEDAPVEPVSWEYRVLTVDAREEALPDMARLNEVGRDGWLLAGIIDQGATGRSGLVHYYFVRRALKDGKEGRS